MNLTEPKIEKIVSSPSSANGSFRDVWFFGDIVIKKDRDNTYSNVGCRAEYQNFLKFSKMEATFELDGQKWSLRFPETSMIGDYLIMQRIPFPDASPEHCDDCEPIEEDFGGGVYYTHGGWGCFLEELEEAVDEACRDNFGIQDMHSLNFKYDIDNRTVWLIDFAA